RNSIEVVKSAHKRPDSGLKRGSEWRKIDLPQRTLGNFCGVVVAPRFGGTVSHPMFGAGQNLVARGVIAALKSPHASARHCGPEVGILSGALDDTSPSCIASDINHRGKNPPYTGGRGFSSCHTGRPFDCHQVPAACFREWHGKDRPISMNNV